MKPDDAVVDLTALENGWDDWYAIILEIDGSNVKIQFFSGNIRWKMICNIKQVKILGLIVK